MKEIDPAAVEVNGEPITVYKLKLVLPPVPLVKMHLVKPILAGAGVTDEAYNAAFIDCLFVSLLRNYEDITRDDLATRVDSTNFKELLASFLKVNMFTKKEESVSGEEQATS